MAAADDGGRGGGLDVDDEMTISSAGDAGPADRAAAIVSPLERRFLCGFPSTSRNTGPETEKSVLRFPVYFYVDNTNGTRKRFDGGGGGGRREYTIFVSTVQRVKATS